MATLKHILFLLILAGLIISCSSSEPASSNTETEPSTPESEISEYYTSSFPRQDVTNELKKAQQSIVRVVSTAFYDNYIFDEQYITMDDIRTNNPGKISTDSFSSKESTAGTSIILDQNSDNSLLLTCEHTVSFPDTAVAYYEDENLPPQKFVESISIKRRQTNLVFLGPELESFEVISSNSRLDVALLNVEFGRDSNLDQHELMIKPGNSDLLRLGSFIYILGFPKGYPMVTRGLASSSESWNDRYFISDATFNPGISGGLVLATKDNYNTFEWVGIASSSSASRESVLVPRPITEDYSRAARPYSDSVFVQQQTRINYGITQAVPINKIKEFLRNSEQEISKQGFTIESSFLSSN